MARIVLDIPSEKLQPFLQMVVGLGIDKHAIASKASQSSTEKPKRRGLFHSFRQKFLLFDWEFFSNELEFE